MVLLRIVATFGARIEHQMGGQKEASRERMLGQNTARLFKFDVDERCAFATPQLTKTAELRTTERPIGLRLDRPFGSRLGFLVFFEAMGALRFERRFRRRQLPAREIGVFHHTSFGLDRRRETGVGIS
jgi:hypothetical protein